MSVHRASVTSESPDKQHTTCKNKRKKTLDTSIKREESIQEPDKPSKRGKADSIPDEGKKPKETISTI